MNLAWHFVKLVGGKPVLRDGRPLPAIGEWLEEKEAVICVKGLHASWKALDALSYRPSGSLAACLVEVDAVAAEHCDKFVCYRRRIIDWLPCDDILRLFARKAAESVLTLWKSPVPNVVREYLATGDGSRREQARAYAATYDAAAYADYATAAACAAAAAYAAAYDDACAAAAAAAYAAAYDDAAYPGADSQSAREELNIMLESMLLSEMNPD